MTVYPALRSLVGANVPDLRGLFLRGHGGQSDALGVLQGDTIRNIQGNLTGAGSYGAIISHVPYAGQTSSLASGAFKVRKTYGWGAMGHAHSAYDLEFDSSRVVPTATENRPVNMAVRYLIRALP